MTTLATKPIATLPQSLYAIYGKRVVDVVGAIVLIVGLAPVLLLISLVVFVRLGMPLLYRQPRIGRNGREFEIFKFRTMTQDRRELRCRKPDHEERRRVFKSDEDDRHTRTGRFLRKWSLDELPQLLNVLRGDMSLVGPRPEIADAAILAGILDHDRHLVRPGITGVWQVSSRDTLVISSMQLDVEYIEGLSLAADLRLMLETIPAVLSGGGR